MDCFHSAVYMKFILMLSAHSINREYVATALLNWLLVTLNNICIFDVSVPGDNKLMAFESLRRNASYQIRHVPEECYMLLSNR